MKGPVVRGRVKQCCEGLDTGTETGMGDIRYELC